MIHQETHLSISCSCKSTFETIQTWTVDNLLSREFHLSMTRSAKKNFLRSSRQRCLANFRLWPLVRLLLLTSNNESQLRVSVGVESCTVVFLLLSTALPIYMYFFRRFCCRMYRLATKHSERLRSWQSSITDFRHQKQKLTLVLIYSPDDYSCYSSQCSTGWAKKSKPYNFCNNFVYCHPIFIIFGT